MRLPVIAAVAVPEPDERGEVVLGPSIVTKGSLLITVAYHLVLGHTKNYYPLYSRCLVAVGGC